MVKPIVLLFPLFIILLFSPSDASAKNLISIQQSTWSNKDITKLTASYCNGRQNCDYKLATKYIGAPLNPGNKSFKVAWNCGDDAKLYERSVLHDAENKLVKIRCQQNLSGVLNFKTALTDHSADAIDSSLPPKCLDFVKSVYASGNDFSLDYIKSNIKNIAQTHMPSGENDLIFYHWTNASEMKQIVQRNGYEEFFTFIRSKRSENWWNYLFYIAEDPVSSKSFGNIRISVYLKDDVKVLSEFDVERDPVEFRRTVIRELKQKLPNLAHNCDLNAYYAEDGGLNFYYLAIADSDVDIIQYWNSWLSRYFDHPNDYHYFQILTPRAIEKVSM